jgi:DNA-binding MarR family transcriptional regulator
VTADPIAPRDHPPEREAPLPPVLAKWSGFLLGKLRQRSLELAIARLAGTGIQPRDFGVLTTLAATGPKAQQDLADLLLVNRTMMVALVDDLEAAGLVERRRNPADRRAYALELTDAGREAVARATPEIGAAEEELLAPLGAAERKRLIELLTAVVVEPGETVAPHLAPHIGYLLAIGQKRGLDTVQAALGKIGLRLPGNGVLAVLADEGPRSQRDLAAALRVNRSVMVQVVDDLEAAGLVERRRNPADRRAYALELTEAGRQRARQAEEVIGRVHDAVLGALSPAERDELHSLLLRLVQA